MNKLLIERTRKYFADASQKCIDEVLSGRVKVNDVDKYIKWREEQIKEALSGTYDHTLHFRQVAHFLETCETIAILP